MMAEVISTALELRKTASYVGMWPAARRPCGSAQDRFLDGPVAALTGSTHAPVPVSTADDATAEATRIVSEAIGELMAFWNFKPSMGRVWSVLYLSQDPLCADEIGKRTGLSAGSVSMTVQELLSWGVLRQAWRPGSRKRHYVAETDILAMVTRVFRERELDLIDRSVKQLEAAAALLDAAQGALEPGRLLHVRFLAGRVHRLLLLSRAGRAVVARFAQGGLLDLRSLRDALGRTP